MAKAKNSEKAIKPNIFMRIGLFIKQIIDELRKVVTPTSRNCSSGPSPCLSSCCC